MMYLLLFFGEAFLGMDLIASVHPSQEAAEEAFAELFGMPYQEYVRLCEVAREFADEPDSVPEDLAEDIRNHSKWFFPNEYDEWYYSPFALITEIDGSPKMIVGQSSLM